MVIYFRNNNRYNDDSNSWIFSFIFNSIGEFIMVKDHLEVEFDEFYRTTNLLTERDRCIPGLRKILYLVWMKGYAQAIKNNIKDLNKAKEEMYG